MTRNGLRIAQEAFSAFRAEATQKTIAIRLKGIFGGLGGYSIFCVIQPSVGGGIRTNLAIRIKAEFNLTRPSLTTGEQLLNLGYDPEWRYVKGFEPKVREE